MPPVDVAAIRAAHPIVDVVEAAGIRLRRGARTYIGRCPFHEDSRASFTIYPDTERWWCFGCAGGGDVLDFVGRLNGTDFRETAAGLSRGMPLPANVTPLRPARREQRPTHEELAAVDAAVSFYTRFLPDRDAQDYLRMRGIDPVVARRLRVGYGRPGLREHLRRKGLGLAAARSVGLISEKRERFVGRLIVPEVDASGRAIWMTGRATGERRLRYLDLSIPSPLLGLSRVRASGSDIVVVVEGPLDWLTACGWRVPCVSLNGSHADEAALRMLASFQRVYLALDANTPGRLAAERIAAELGDRAVTLSLPEEAHDLNLLGRLEGGRDLFFSLVANAREQHEAERPAVLGGARAA